MCGMAPTVPDSKRRVSLGASRARLTAYGHSGQQTGDDRSVVAYAGVIIL